MMQPTVIDHILFVLLAFISPLYWRIRWDTRHRPRIEKGGSSARLAVYREGIIDSWLTTAGVLACWFLLSHRPAAGLGFRAPDGWPFWAGGAVCVVYVIIGVKQVADIRTKPDAREKLLSQVRGDAAALVPHTGAERRWFVGVGITAGICEEILSRGFMMWYLSAWLPMAAVVMVSALLFGFGHLFLGWGHVLRSGAAGLVFGLAYVLTGSLWVPMLLHATIDILSGNAAHAALDGPRIDAGRPGGEGSPVV